MNEQRRTAQIDQAVRGDPDAFQRLIVEYHAPLRAAVEGAMDALVRPHLDPDDVLQEAYVAVFKGIGDCRFDGPGRFYKWLETIVLNELKNRRRALKSRKRDAAREIRSVAQAATSYPDLVHRLAASDTKPSRRVARSEAVAAVLSSLARLSDDQRAVVCGRFLQGQSVAEVAARLGKTEDAVHALCRRALKALRKSLVSISRYLTRW